MRQYLLATLMCCSYSVAAGDNGIPAAFHGQWDLSLKDCKAGGSDGSLAIAARAVDSYGGNCRLKTVKSAGANTFSGSLTCSSEGESETRPFTLKLEKGKLFVDEDRIGLVRCK